MNYNNLTKEELIKEIKALKKIGHTVRKNENIIPELIDYLTDAVAVADEKGNLLAVNQNFGKLFGINRKNIKNFHFRNFNTSDGKNLNTVYGNILKRNKSQKVNLIINNSVYNLDISVLPVSSGKNIVIFKTENFGFENDVSLLINEAVFKTLIDNLDIGISVIDEDMRIVLSNSIMKKYFPALDDLKKYTCYKLYNVPPRNKPCDYCPTIRTFNDGKIHDIITETPLNDSIVNYRVISSPVKDKNGNVKFVIEMVEDITGKIQTEFKLKEQLRFTEYLVDSIPTPIFYKDISGKYLFCNSSFSEYFDFPKNEITGKSSFDIYDKHYAEIFNQMDNELMKTGEIQTYEFSFFNVTDNGKRDLLLTKAPFYNFNGDIAGVIGIIIDITDRKNNERTLIESREYIKNLIDTANIMIISLDVNGKILLFNKKAEEITGYKSSEVIGNYYFDIIVPKNKYPEIYKSFLSFVEKGQVSSENMENYILTKKGKEKLISWRNNEIKTNGILKGILAFGIDITETKESESVIRKLSRAVEQTSDLVYITDAQGKIEYINPSFTAVTGYTKEDVLGKNPKILKSGKMKKSFYEDLWKTISSGKNWYGEFLNKKKNGELFYSYGSISPIKDDKGNITNYIAINADISSVKLAYEELKKMKEKIDESDKIKYSFLSNMSGELKTPLINILGFTEILNNEIKDSWQQEILSDIQKQGKRLLRTLSLILKLAQLEAGDLIPNLQKINFNQLTEEIFEDYRQAADAKGLEFSVTHSKDVITVQSDTAMLKDIIQNLLDNAVKFTEKGFVKTSCEIVKQNDRTYALFKVRDSGKGIPEDKLNSIFGDFIKIESSIHRRSEGSGLGLSVASKMAKLLECKIDAESSPGKGSEFFLYIPLLSHYTPSKYDFPKSDKSGITSKKTGAYKNNDRPSVLVVEDNLSNINIVEIFLNNICTVESVTSGEEALKIIKKTRYDLIIMDINLGKGINGINTAKEIMKSKKYGNVPIIAVTGYALYSDREKLLSEGFTDYLAKPFTKNQLISIILKYVKK